jgi:ribose-phosphate pyrophosphokinase
MAKPTPKIYAIPAAMNFAEEICKGRAKWQVEKMSVTSFPCGETRVAINDSVRGQDIYLIGWGVGSPSGTVNEHMMQLLIVINALKLASANMITVVLPNAPYSRQDRKDASRQPITAKLVADLLQAAGCQHLITMDLHAAQIQGFYDFPVDNLYGSPTLIDALVGDMDKTTSIAVVSPDAGGHKRVEDMIARMRKKGFQNIEMVYMHKVRDKLTGEVLRQQTIGDPGGRHCILVDDMGDTCGTLIRGASKLREVGVLSVVAAITHGVFSRDAIDKLCCDSCPIDATYVTDTCLVDVISPETKIKVVSVANVFADAILANHKNESVSHLFD